MNHSISQQAVTFLNDIFEQYHNTYHIRLKIENPGTPSATVSLDLESAEQMQKNPNLIAIPVGTGAVFFETQHTPFVQNLTIGYKATLTGGELEIDLPLLYGDQTALTLIERIRLLFQKEIQPALDAHRGHAIVKDLSPEGDLYIAFAGGCQGCSMASVTLKNIIDEKIRQHFPQVRNIIDSTNHAEGRQPYA